MDISVRFISIFNPNNSKFIRARVAIISDVEGYIIEGNSFGQERTAQPGRILNLSLGWKEKNYRPKPSEIIKLGPLLRLPHPPTPSDAAKRKVTRLLCLQSVHRREIVLLMIALSWRSSFTVANLESFVPLINREDSVQRQICHW